MTIKIEIEVPTDLVLKGIGSEYLDMAAGALGFTRGVSSVPQAASGPMLNPEYVGPTELASQKLRIDDAPEQAETATATEVAELAKNDAPKRERGKPSQGRARRTKEEIAEDEAADAADAAKQTAAVEANLTDDVKPAISTGGERVSPEDEQDAADEAAETEKTGLQPIDILRRLLGAYQKKHGMPASVKLCQEGGLIGASIHELDDAGIEAAIARMETAGVSVAEAPAETETKAETPAPLERKTKDDLMKAMGAYAAKFDGYVVKNYPPSKEDADRMTHTLADCPRIFAATFGDSVQKLSQVPEDKYAEAVAAVEAAIEADPYGRAK